MLAQVFRVSKFGRNDNLDGRSSNLLKARKGGGGGYRRFSSFHICDRAAKDEQVEKTDHNPTLRS